MLTHHTAKWFAVVVRGRWELRTGAALASKGYEFYVPIKEARSGLISRKQSILFPGYVFCKFVVTNRLTILTTPGVLSIVSLSGIPVSIDETELENIRRLIASGLATSAQSYLPVGHRVRVVCGPLSGVEGVIVQADNNIRLSVCIELLSRSLSVELDRTVVVPVERRSSTSLAKSSCFGNRLLDKWAVSRPLEL